MILSAILHIATAAAAFFAGQSYAMYYAGGLKLFALLTVLFSLGLGVWGWAV